MCVIHGAGSGLVKARAKERLEALVFPALAALRKAITSKEPEDKNAAIRAAIAVLDRTGFGAKSELEVEVTTPPAPLDARGKGTIDSLPMPAKRVLVSLLSFQPISLDDVDWYNRTLQPTLQPAIETKALPPHTVSQDRVQEPTHGTRDDAPDHVADPTPHGVPHRVPDPTPLAVQVGTSDL